MTRTERDNINAATNGGRTYTIPAVNPRTIRRGPLTLVGSDHDYKMIFCRGCSTPQYGRGAKRDKDNNIYCAKCLSGSAA